MAVSWTPYGSLRGSLPSGLRLLHVAATRPGRRLSLLRSSRLLIPGRALSPVQITGSGNVVLAAARVGTGEQLWEYSAAPGRLLRRFPLAPPARPQGDGYCGVLWASPTASVLFTQCSGFQQVISNGAATRVRLALAVPAPVIGAANTFAW